MALFGVGMGPAITASRDGVKGHLAPMLSRPLSAFAYAHLFAVFFTLDLLGGAENYCTMQHFALLLAPACPMPELNNLGPER